MNTEFSVSFRKRDAYDQMRELHSHSGLCELYFLSSGERRYFIQDTVVPVHGKSLVFIKPGLLHRTSYLGGGVHWRYHSTFPASWIEDILPYLPPFFVVQKEEGLELLFSQLLQEYEKPDDFSPSRARALATEIVIRAYRDWMSESRSQDAFLDEVSRYVRENIDKDLSLDAISSHMGLSSSYFSTLFHYHSGMRLSEFIRSTRIAIALDALDKGASVSKAAEKAGYNDPGYFKDVFRKVMKISPSAYKKSRHES